MSLINEALKRAEAEKTQRLADVPPLPPLVAVPRARLHLPARRWPTVQVGLLAAALVAISITGYVLVKSYAAGVPQEAAAAPGQVASLTPSPTAVAGVPRPASPGRAESPATAPTPAAHIKESAGPDRAQALRDAFAARAEDAMEIQRLAVLNADASARHAAPAPVPGVPPPSQPAPAAKPAEPEDDAARFKVSSIMVGPKSATAIINGRIVAVGDVIGQAKVLRITPSTVDLDVSGRRVQVGMQAAAQP
jgi:hypothetical protein